jgi:hypothetical protein
VEEGAAFEVLNQALACVPYADLEGTFTYVAFPVATVIALVAEYPPPPPPKALIALDPLEPAPIASALTEVTPSGTRQG